ncbi:hypothetical protein [Entomobacter blattae]|uniref:hypothetical protein n=1 Tax=Entomobacter blattae TaxID=2762277 RepID=UPI00193BFD4A|nr:hypothetical protein [Entomobacter blattae]
MDISGIANSGLDDNVLYRSHDITFGKDNIFGTGHDVLNTFPSKPTPHADSHYAHLFWAHLLLGSSSSGPSSFGTRASYCGQHFCLREYNLKP